MAQRAAGEAFLARVAAWAGGTRAGEAFTRYLARATPPDAAGLYEALYRALADWLLATWRLPASPGAAHWEWAPLYRLNREIDPHYFTERDVERALAECPALPADTRAEWRELLVRYFHWRQTGFGPLGEPPFLPAESCAAWLALFPPRLAWAALDVPRRAGLVPLGHPAGFRARQRHESGEFAPALTVSAWEGWVADCVAAAPPGPRATHELDFLAAAFADAQTPLGVAGFCGDPPRCGDCPLAEDCAWHTAPGGTPASADEAQARLLAHGTEGLDTAALLQAVFRLEPAAAADWRRRLDGAGLRSVAQRPPGELGQWLEGLPPGPGRLRALLALAEQLGDERLEPGDPFKGAADVFRHFRMRVRDSRQEQFLLIMLDTRRRYRGEVAVSKGTMERALVHPRDVFAVPLREHAASIVVAHNHPSGDPTPSPEDINLTKRLTELGELMGIPVLDHVIIGEADYVSLAERGLLRMP